MVGVTTLSCRIKDIYLVAAILLFPLCRCEDSLQEVNGDTDYNFRASHVSGIDNELLSNINEKRGFWDKRGYGNKRGFGNKRQMMEQDSFIEPVLDHKVSLFAQYFPYIADSRDSLFKRFLFDRRDNDDVKRGFWDKRGYGNKRFGQYYPQFPFKYGKIRGS